jgi:hypothetical protein
MFSAGAFDIARSGKSCLRLRALIYMLSFSRTPFSFISRCAQRRELNLFTLRAAAAHRDIETNELRARRMVCVCESALCMRSWSSLQLNQLRLLLHSSGTFKCMGILILNFLLIYSLIFLGTDCSCAVIAISETTQYASLFFSVLTTEK